jgi:hypothetical protein
MDTCMVQPRSACCVCGAKDARLLVQVTLVGGTQATLCGSHALMHNRAGSLARSEAELKTALADRRGRRDRRQDGDELGAALTAAFQGTQRSADRRGT